MKTITTNNYTPVTTSALLKFTSSNLITLLEQHKLSQKDLAAITGVAESTVSAIRNQKQFPTIDFLFSLKTNFDISIDDFITKNISPNELSSDPISSELEKTERLAYQKYCGTYFVYYFDTSKYKGRDYNNPKDSLMFGVLHIYENPTPLNKLDYSCIAILGIKEREDASEIKNKLEQIEDISSLLDFVNREYCDKTYYGDFELTHYHAFLSMSHQSKDKLLAIFHRVPGDKSHYAGGIGTINSVSRGRESMPVVQFIGISKNKVALSNEEIHHNLLLNYPNFKANDEADDLIRLFKNLYLASGEYSESLTELQKAITIKANLERYIKKSLERNMFRYGKISNRDDDEWYHALKEVAILDTYDDESAK